MEGTSAGPRVRAILVAHAAGRSVEDPNAIVEAQALADALATVEARAGPASDRDAALRAAAHDYVALWARTFRTLVRHLRGRPERALALFVEEVYPFLRGDRLAARLESAQPGRARLLASPGIPHAYAAGLVEAFVALSGAQATCSAGGTTPNGVVLELRYKAAAGDRAARLAQAIATMRIPLVACAGLAAGVGVAIAAGLAGPAGIEPLRAILTILGALAVQVGANALHELRSPHPAGPLGPMRLGRRALQAIVAAGYAVAGAIGAWLALAQPLVLAFAAAGLVLSLLFGRFRNAGWGPLIAGATYPLLALGAVHAALPSLAPSLRFEAIFALPIGAAAAAMLHLDDLADRPLDEAGGHRTLAVRLPQPHQALVFCALAAGGGATLMLAAFLVGAPAVDVAAGAALAAAGLLLAEVVRRRIFDPAALAPARIATFILAAGCAAASMALALGGPA